MLIYILVCHVGGCGCEALPTCPLAPGLFFLFVSGWKMKRRRRAVVRVYMYLPEWVDGMQPVEREWKF